MQAFSHLTVSPGFPWLPRKTQSTEICLKKTSTAQILSRHHPLSGLKHGRCWHSFRQHLRYEACLAAIDASSTRHAHTSILTVQNRQSLQGMKLQEDQFWSVRFRMSPLTRKNINKVIQIPGSFLFGTSRTRVLLRVSTTTQKVVDPNEATKWLFQKMRPKVQSQSG